MCISGSKVVAWDARPTPSLFHFFSFSWSFRQKSCNLGFYLKQKAVAKLHSKILYAPSGPNSFNFMQFLGNFGEIVCWWPPPEGWHPPLCEILDPPLMCYEVPAVMKEPISMFPYLFRLPWSVIYMKCASEFNFLQWLFGAGIIYVYLFIYLYLPSATKLRRLCFYRRLSVHRGVGVSASVHAGLPPPRSRHPPSRHPPEQTPPWEQTPPPEIRPLLRKVRILLECILVIYFLRNVWGAHLGSTTDQLRFIPCRSSAGNCWQVCCPLKHDKPAFYYLIPMLLYNEKYCVFCAEYCDKP